MQNHYGKILNKKAFTSRHYVLKAAKDKRLNKILDAHFKGKKRKEFDDKSDKKYNTAKTLHQDIAHVGLYKRYKLIERNYNKYFNKETFKIMFDSDYFPKQKDKKWNQYRVKNVMKANLYCTKLAA